MNFANALMSEQADNYIYFVSRKYLAFTNTSNKLVSCVILGKLTSAKHM
jgi:hypothetical protein